MNHRSEFDGEGDDAIPTAAPTCPGVRRRDNVLPFRRVEAAASCVGPAASSPYSADGLDAFRIASAYTHHGFSQPQRHKRAQRPLESHAIRDFCPCHQRKYKHATSRRIPLISL
jgi:hypothetical protein